MEDEVLIDETNLFDLKDQDLEGLEALLSSEDMNIDTTPEPLDIPSCGKDLIGMGMENIAGDKKNIPPITSRHEEISYRVCKCGNIIYKNHRSEFRCGGCGCILY